LDTPYEQKIVVDEMVKQVISIDKNMEIFFKKPYTLEETLEYPLIHLNSNKGEFKREFDADMGNLSSKLISYEPNAENVIYDAIREVLGLSRNTISLQEALELVTNPERNKYLASSLEVSTMSKLNRVLYNTHYIFKKRMSHCADSQNQRHRMTPASRPSLILIDNQEPDYIVPSLIKQDSKILEFYEKAMYKIWDYYNKF
ncbi:MAG: FAD-dependent thymidylate synthase, partial [Planctomycetota bacterium]